MLATQSPDFETPVGALSSLNLETYDRVIREFREKDAERDAAKRRLVEILTPIADTIATVLARFPELVARTLATEFRKLETAERVLNDGIIPPQIDQFLSRIKNDRDKLAEAYRGITKALKTPWPAIGKVDPKISLRLRQLFGELAHVVKGLVAHYDHMVFQCETLVRRAKSPLTGRIQRASKLYKDAFGAVSGVRGVGEVRPNLSHTPPLYELPVAIDPRIYGNRSRLRELECEVDDYVERRDPRSVGAITFRFEFADGAA
jgi:hypothetical protein